ncbi:DoxX family protein [Streptomyces sp. NBC_01304]|uniref:DoxX family protein n=1 Tax=Streptomyces sp. NBC_01304 TaxID=2903818 RepID=UPI002E0D133D|nr:DoxX family protein [Streptomyces sp. NBC_01304]
MFTAYVAVAAVTIAANVYDSVISLLRTEAVLANSAKVGVPESWLTPLALLKLAGSAGLLLGLLGVPLIDVAAAAGLVAFFVGALITHVRARVFYNIAFPGAYLALAIASLVLAL